jgi:hypothetical protein
MQTTAVNDELGLRVTVDFDAIKVTVNGATQSLQDERQAALLLHLIDKHPKILTFGAIDQLILKKYGVGQGGGNSGRQYIHNRVRSLRDLLDGSLNGHEFIKNMRGSGYALADGWRKEEVVQDIFEQLDAIDEIVIQAIELCDSCDIENKGADDQDVLVLNTDRCHRKVLELKDEYTRVADQLCNSLPLPTIDQEFIAIAEMLRLIESYVAMQRRGSGIDDATWKRFYREELAGHVKRLKVLVRLSSAR